MQDAATLLDNTVRVTQYGSAHYIKIGDAGCACNALMASHLSGVSLRARRSSTQVMLGCHCGPDGTRARSDTSLVLVNNLTSHIVFIRTVEGCFTITAVMA